MWLKIISLTNYFWTDFREFVILYVCLFVTFVFGAYLLFKWKTASWIKVIAVNVFLFVCLFVHLFYLAEIYYRYIFDATDNVLQTKTMQRWIQRHVRINAYSFRNDHFFKEKDPKELRLAVVGDSYSYGYGIENEADRYSNLLESKLNQTCQASGGTAKVYNMARPGMNTKEEAETIRLFAREHHVDEVIVGYTLDDARSNRTPLHTDVCYNRIFQYKNHPLLRLLIDKSFAIEYWYVRLYGKLFARDYTNQCWGNSQQTLYQDPEIWLRHIKDLKSLIDLTRKDNIGLVVIIFPEIQELGENYQGTFIHERIIKFFTENKIPTIDLLPVYLKYKPQELMANKHDFHANELGHRLAFEALYETIKDKPWAQCKTEK